ncbi:MAG: 3D domain-containing protein [Planctomycetota bacterium]
MRNTRTRTFNLPARVSPGPASQARNEGFRLMAAIVVVLFFSIAGALVGVLGPNDRAGLAALAPAGGTSQPPDARASQDRPANAAASIGGVGTPGGSTIVPVLTMGDAVSPSDRGFESEYAGPASGAAEVAAANVARTNSLTSTTTATATTATTTSTSARAAGGTTSNAAANADANDLILFFDGRPIRPVRTVTMVVTAYSPDARSCAPFDDGITASGKSVWTNGGKLIAADKKYAYGTLMSVPGYNGGRPTPVLDRGGAIKGNRLDVLYPTHNIARQWGVQRLTVTIWEYAD